MTHCVSTSVVAEADLRRHVRATDCRRLLLCAVHVTRDASLIDTFAGELPPVAVGLNTLLGLPEEPGGSPELRERLTGILASVLTRQDQPAYLRAEDPALFERMAAVGLAGPVDRAQIPMWMEQSGFVPEQRRISPSQQPSPELNLAILGAGMTGLDAAVKAADRGFEFTVFEQEDGIGGLWFSQRYPGVGVDTPSLYYSLSFEVTPDWSKFYPLGDEYREYLTALARKYGVADRVQLGSEVTRLEWIEDDQQWELTVADRRTRSARQVRAAAVLTGAGQFNRPQYPDIPGRQTFKGEQVHTFRWRDIDVDAKRVAVIGVGASGIQVIGALAPVVGRMTVFQRQPHWVAPNTLPGAGHVPDSERWLRRHLPYYLHWSRFLSFAVGSEFGYASCKVDREWMSTHPLSVSPMNDAGRQVTLQYINDTFGESSELARKLTPDYPYNGKRPIRDPGGLEPGGYYWAFLQPHVDLVTAPIVRVVPDGLLTADGSVHQVDAIIWATGMRMEYLSSLEIVGRGGRRLAELWADDNARSYLGGTVPGFPNLFVNDGPNTGVAAGGFGHNFMTEAVNHYAFECLQLMVERNAASVEVTREAHDAHNERIEALMADMIWSHDRRAHTYYRNAAGRVVLPSPFHPNDYWTLSQQPDESAFLLGVPSPAVEVPA